MTQLSNPHVTFSFDSRTGALQSIRNGATGNLCLQRAPGCGNPFALYYDFHRTFAFPCSPNGPEPLPDPATLTNKTFSPESADSVAVKQKDNSLQMTYRQGPWQAQLTIAMKDRSSQWTLKVKNISDNPCQMMSVFPYFRGILPGKSTHNLMVVNDEAGYIRPLWTPGKERGGIYGHGGQMSMQWGCMFNDQTHDALGFIVEDDEFRGKEIIYDKPSLQVRHFPPIIVRPGQTVSFPSVRILVYAGDWKPTAADYHRWFTKNVPLAPIPDWAREIDTHRGRWILKKGQETPGIPEAAIRMVGYCQNSFAEMPEMMLHEPADLFELAFFNRAGMGPKRSGMHFVHTDGDSAVREDLGGVPALREGIRRLHRLGSRLKLYIEGYIVSDDAKVALDGRAHDWAVMNADASNAGPYTSCHALHMCPGSVGWQDYLAKTCADLVRRTDADAVRLDSLGCYFFPCYNPKHRHDNPFDYNQWVSQLLQKVAAAVRKVKPDCLLTTELPVDFFRRYFHGALTQYFTDAPVAITRDVPPMRVALPENHIILHCPHGPVSASLAGYPGGSLYWNDPKANVDLELKWRSARFGVADVIRWGSAEHDNPQASRNDVACRRFSTADLDVIVGARYQYPNTGKPGYLEKNAHINIKRNPVRFDVHLDDMPAKPQRVLLVDILNATVREIPCKNKRFAVDCNWFILIVQYHRAKPFAWMDSPTATAPGNELELNIHLAGQNSSRPIRARLVAPTLNLDQNITIPGLVRLQLPKTTTPGTHTLTLTSPKILCAKTFVTIQSR